MEDAVELLNLFDDRFFGDGSALKGAIGVVVSFVSWREMSRIESKTPRLHPRW